MRFIFLFLFFSLSLLWLGSQAWGNTANVQDVFIDIDSNYEYLEELQQLYDRGMIVTDASRRFNPDSLLDRDEFVGITMEVICEKCIQPQTQISLLQQYADTQAYFDVPKTNPYFYCIEEADDKDYVRGYGLGVRCEDGSWRVWERPFCPDNRILLEEAIAVLLRNSGIFTIEDNQRITQDIRAGLITQALAPDTLPTDSLWEPYTFYWYLRKALEFQITEFDILWNSETLRLLELDLNWNINPKKFITREEFLKMAYIIFKSNNCIDTDDSSFALAIDIWEKECSPWATNCNLSNLDDPEDTYDFSPDIEWFCEDGIENPNGYFWRFYNTRNGQEFFRYGEYLDNITLLSEGVWRISLRVTDRCGNSSQVYSEIVVWPSGEGELWISVDIIATPIYWFTDLRVEFEAIIEWWVGPFTYGWDFWTGDTNVWRLTEYLYVWEGTYRVRLIVTDSEWRTWESTVVIQVLDRDRCLQDSDNDGINDCDDLCPTIVGPIENRWCPIFERMCDADCGCPDGYECSDIDPLTCWSWVCRPISIPQSCLFTPTVWAIFWTSVCNSCPCFSELNFLSDMRRCDLVFPAITSPDGQNIYSRWQAVIVPER